MPASLRTTPAVDARRVDVRTSARFYYSIAGAVFFCAFTYLLSGVVGVWAAYDGAAALALYLAMIVGVAPIFLMPLLVSRGDVEQIAWILGLLASFALVVLALIVFLQRQGESSWSDIASSLARLHLTDNMSGGMVAILAPPVMALAILGWRKRRMGFVVVAGMASLAGLVVLAVTESRGATIGLMVGIGLFFYLLVRSRSGKVTLVFRIIDVALVFGLAVFLAAYAAAILQPGLDKGVGVIVFGDSAQSRLALWRDALPLVQDYWYTGAGPGATTMVLSTYAFLVHVPFLVHAHNLYLQIILEQGIFGVVAFVGMFVGSIAAALSAWRMASSSMRIALSAWIASLVALLVHGLFDAELYASAFRASTLLSVAVLGLLSWLVVQGSGSPMPHRWREWLVGPSIAIVALMVPFGTGNWSAIWYANLGAVLQTKAQLARYASGEWVVPDSVLRVESPELTQAESRFTWALQIDPMNATANRRLGQIAVARGEYDSAFVLLQNASQALFPSRLTLQYLGELYALKNEPERAAEIWRGLDSRQGQLAQRVWWYEQEIGDADLMQRMKLAVAIEAPQR